MVYALHPDGTESVIENDKQFDRHVENGGLFAAPKEDWMKYLENGEFLRTTEISTEQNYNMIDGRRNNMEPHKKEKPSKEKESLLGRLKEKQQFLIANARKEDKEKRAERDLPKMTLGIGLCKSALSYPRFFVFSGYCAKNFTYNSVKPLDIIPNLEYNI